MTQLSEETMTQDGVRFHFIETNKFKTIHFVVKCKALLNRDTITKRALLPYVLEKGTKNYPTEKQLMRKLASLYGASLSIDSNKKGNYHIINFRMQIANEKFIKGENNLFDEALILLQEVIFQPLQENDGFHETIVKREKKSLKNDITAIYDDKVALANQRLIEAMCKDELYSIASNGYIDDLTKIDATNLFAYYDQVLQQDTFDVYVLGDFQKEHIAEKVMQLFANKPTKPPLADVVKETVTISDVKVIQEIQAIEQTKLHIGYRTNCTFQDEDYFALLLMNGLFGSFPNSKLFQEVREKHSLAYYATSRIESHKGLLIVLCGIDGANSKQTIDIIQKQLTAMQEGDFTHAEISETKALFMNDLRETFDSAGGMIELFYQQIVGGRVLSIEQYMDGIQAVSKADVIQVAKNIELDTIFLLTNEEVEVMDDGKNSV